MAPLWAAFSSTSGLSTPTTSHPDVAGSEADGAPDQADPDDPERAAHASERPYDPVVLVRVTDRHPAPARVAEGLAFTHQDAGPLEDLRSRPYQDEVALGGDVVRGWPPGKRPASGRAPRLRTRPRASIFSLARIDAAAADLGGEVDGEGETGPARRSPPPSAAAIP